LVCWRGHERIKKDGLENNTLVIFTSDNGPWLNFGNHAGSSGGLREGKGTTYDGGQKEPCIMRWPGVIPPGSICNKMASTLDILPTATAIVHGSLPNHKIDGINILSLLKGEKDADPRKTLYYYYRRNNLEAVRSGQWKLVFAHKGRSYENQQPGKDGFPGTTPEDAKIETGLYDLRRDPGERYDVQKSYPDIVKELMLLAEEARDDLGDDLQNRKGKKVRSSGLVKN
jgi:arylsulfatase A-like enzyme